MSWKCECTHVAYNGVSPSWVSLVKEKQTKNVRTSHKAPWYMLCSLFLTVICLYTSVSTVLMSPWWQEAHLSKTQARVPVYISGRSNVVSYPNPEDGSSVYLDQLAELSAREYSTKFCRRSKLQYKLNLKTAACLFVCNAHKAMVKGKDLTFYVQWSVRHIAWQ